MEDRYSVLIKLENQLSADGFYCSYNGKRFKPSEVRWIVVFLLEDSNSFCVCCINMPFWPFTKSLNFRWRFAMYTFLNRLTTTILQKWLAYLPLGTRSCPRALFVQVCDCPDLISCGCELMSLSDAYVLFRSIFSERLDPDTSGIQSTLCDHSSRCSCIMKWTYLSCPVGYLLIFFSSYVLCI